MSAALHPDLGKEFVRNPEYIHRRQLGIDDIGQHPALACLVGAAGGRADRSQAQSRIELEDPQVPQDGIGDQVLVANTSTSRRSGG